MSTPSERVSVLYVGGMPRSGSTLLDLMLGQLPGHCDVGELFYLWTAGPVRDQRCACGEHFASCPFWTEVGHVAFGGWDRVDVEEVLRLQRQVDATRWVPLILAPRLVPSFRKRLDRYTALMLRLYRAVLEVSGADIVVDSTKRPSLAFILRRAPDVDLRLIHLVRDPRAVVYAWTKSVPVPEGSGPRAHLKVRSPRLITRRWLTVNALMALLERLGVPRVVLRYEDLVTRPREALGDVLALHPSTDTDGALGFVIDEGLVLAPSHTVAGGRVRFRRGTVPLRLDEEWRRELPASTRRAVGAITGPLRRRYGYS